MSIAPRCRAALAFTTLALCAATASAQHNMKADEAGFHAPQDIKWRDGPASLRRAPNSPCWKATPPRRGRSSCG